MFQSNWTGNDQQEIDFKIQNCNELFCVEISLALIATIIKTDLKTNVYLKISYDSLLF